VLYKKKEKKKEEEEEEEEEKHQWSYEDSKTGKVCRRNSIVAHTSYHNQRFFVVM